jgi:CBS domain-containing protein
MWPRKVVSGIALFLDGEKPFPSKFIENLRAACRADKSDRGTGFACTDSRHAVPNAEAAMTTPLVLRAATAADLMTHGPVSLSHTASVSEAAAFLTSRGFGAAMIIDDAGHPIGVVTKTDIVIHARERQPGLEPDDTPVTGVMTPVVFAVRTDTPTRSVIEQLLALNVHHLFVTDESGVVVGVVTPIDVLRNLA